MGIAQIGDTVLLSRWDLVMLVGEQSQAAGLQQTAAAGCSGERLEARGLNGELQGQRVLSKSHSGGQGQASNGAQGSRAFWKLLLSGTQNSLSQTPKSERKRCWPQVLASTRRSRNQRLGVGVGGKMTQCSHFPCLLPLGILSPEIKPNIPQQELGMQTSSVGMQFDYFNSRLPFSNCILLLFKKHIPIICFICQGRFSKLTAEPSLLCQSGKPRVQSAAPNNTANPACLPSSLRLYIKKKKCV